MRIEKTVLRETRMIALGTLALAAVEQLVFLAFGAYGYDVLFGTLLSGGAAVLNFFLLGLTVQRAMSVGTPDDTKAKSIMRLSQTVRSFALLAVLAVGVLLDCFSTIAVLVTVLFPRIAIFFRQIMIARALKQNMPAAPDGAADAEAAPEEPEKEGDTDETEY